jgi:hypothetical protein
MSVRVATSNVVAVARGVRDLLPNWRVTMVRPSKELPSNQVTFHIEPRFAVCDVDRLAAWIAVFKLTCSFAQRMNKLELQSYLESIYDIKIAGVQTQNILGEAVCRTPLLVFFF